MATYEDVTMALTKLEEKVLTHYNTSKVRVHPLLRASLLKFKFIIESLVHTTCAYIVILGVLS